MTNLTSEQYRDILKHLPNYTHEIPTVQHLLRTAVRTFFKRFGAYPNLAGVAPGKVGILGEQTQFSDGFVMPAATPMVTIMVGRRVPGPHYSVVTSADVGKPHKVKFSFSSNRPLGPGCPTWLNFVKCAIDAYPSHVPPFEAAIESSVPMGVGFGSSASLELAVFTFLEVLVGKKVDGFEKAENVQKSEREFCDREAGLADRIASILGKDRHLMLIDCKHTDCVWIPFHDPKVSLVAVNSHLKDELLGYEYSERNKYLAKAAEMLGIEDLRKCTRVHITKLENKVNEIFRKNSEKENEENGEEKEAEEKEGQEEEATEANTDTWTKEEYDIMIKRARFFIMEKIRIHEAIDAWKDGDIEAFGEKLTESHKSLKEDFDFNNPVLDFLVDTSLQVEGVLGSKMTGMGLGFGGGIISLVNKNKIPQYCTYITEKFAEHESQLTEQMKESREKEKQRQLEVKKKIHSEHFNPTIASSELIGKVQDYLASGGAIKKIVSKRSSGDSGRKSSDRNTCIERKKIPCIVKVEKPKGGCGTWAHFQKEREKAEFLRKLSLVEDELMKMEGEKTGEEGKKEGEKGSATSAAMSTQVAEASNLTLSHPSFYIISPFPGARMMLVTKQDLLRSRFAQPLPHPKSLVRTAMEEFEATYGNKVEAIGLAPTTLTLFGQFMEFHLGYIISLTMPMYVVTVGGRNDTVFFSFKTTSTEIKESNIMKYPVPSVRPLEMESRSWVNFVMGVVNEFKGHVPGFNAVIHSDAPIQVGLHTCAALQSSVYTFLENLTRECTEDLHEKVDRCSKSEIEFLPAPTELASRCSAIKFLPIFLCREGHVMLINCKNYKISHYFFDDPTYAFLIATCKQNSTEVTIQSLDERLKQCMEAIDILERKSLLFLDQKHLKCLKKRDASEKVIKRAKYVITEHQRTLQAIKAIKEGDYARVGLIMNQSHASLRDDYEVSSPEIEELIGLALKADGVLGAKMLGAGLNATIIILVKLEDADKCIRFMRKNYKDKSDKPVFYLIKPAGGAFSMSPTVDVPYIV